MTDRYDFIVVGGGIAGVSAAYELAAHGSVCLLEREQQLAYHTTGRSAAISMESYGNQQIRSLTCASRSFFENPPKGLAEHPLWAPRGALIVAQAARVDKLAARFTAVLGQVPTAQFLDEKQVLELVPYLAEGAWSAGIFEPSAFDLDVHGLHSAYLGGLRARGGVVKREAEVQRGQYRAGHWTLHTQDGQHLEAAIVVNAAGAWADEFAERCGLPKVGVRPLRRTVLAVDPQCDVHRTPYLGTVDEDIFIKPEAGRLIVSPCDESPSLPCDALPDELDLAITMDRLQSTTRLRPRSIINKWAGLRTFVADRSPVLGQDPLQECFIWLAALGGYGIQAAPAIARLCSHAALGSAMPSDLAALHLNYQHFSPARCRDEEFSALAVRQVADLH
ncbi:glycine/D-amino acid oxidase, deaminating [Pseudomonas sp. GM18]|uniref:NAD(P)/FAD-dependent oxidoreductase n=1 Tax=Pseudomonas sp. GM18 TaxID=1144324 RepID=UPI00027237A5|nr:FAD-dependent oxidoreductase [Pseudomonas sp. GM18]EJM09933.1 glycine/D-amino acid oxidase, deaminating [Pseudomonas sp. GM18]